MGDKKVVKSHKILIIRDEPGDSGFAPAHLSMGAAEFPINMDSLLPDKHLPRDEPPDRTAETKPLEQALILAVEPEEETANEYKSIFRKEGYDLKIASSIAEAVRELKNVIFDCIIIDVDLPDMAGYDAVSVIKSIEPKANVIVTAAKNTKELEARIRKEDIFYYYIKSFDREELKLAVQNALSRG